MRLVFLSRDFLNDVVTNELVRENCECLKLISDAVKLTSFTCEGDLPQSPRKGLETRAIVACGGKYTLCYLPEKDEWKSLADGLSKRSQFTQIINYRDQLFAFPSNGKAERYDPVFNGWCTLDLSTTSSAKVTVVNGEICSLEINTSSKQTTIKRFNVERCSWQPVLSSYEGCREESCVVAAGKHLYVCGGWLEDDCVAKAERFDAVENKWEAIANMQEKRVQTFGVATKGNIFLAGGLTQKLSGSIVDAKTCEMYNISTNEWQLIGSLKVPRFDGSMVCVKGTLYVLGGTNHIGESRLSVEGYDPTEDKWIEKTTIPVKMICKDNKHLFTGCVLKLSKGVLDKLDVIKE